MMMIVVIRIESEGDVNGFFTLISDDRSKRSGWSCDQGSIEMDDEEKISDEESELCFQLWFSMELDPENYDSRQCGEFELINGEWVMTKEYIQLSV
jgi:hypothetical protein